MFETTTELCNERNQLAQTLEEFQQFADLKLVLIGGGTGAVILE